MPDNINFSRKALVNYDHNPKERCWYDECNCEDIPIADCDALIKENNEGMGRFACRVQNENCYNKNFFTSFMKKLTCQFEHVIQNICGLWDILECMREYLKKLGDMGTIHYVYTRNSAISSADFSHPATEGYTLDLYMDSTTGVVPGESDDQRRQMTDRKYRAFIRWCADAGNMDASKGNLTQMTVYHSGETFTEDMMIQRGLHFNTVGPTEHSQEHCDSIIMPAGTYLRINITPAPESTGIFRVHNFRVEYTPVIDDPELPECLRDEGEPTKETTSGTNSNQQWVGNKAGKSSSSTPTHNQALKAHGNGGAIHVNRGDTPNNYIIPSIPNPSNVTPSSPTTPNTNTVGTSNNTTTTGGSNTTTTTDPTTNTNPPAFPIGSTTPSRIPSPATIIPILNPTNNNSNNNSNSSPTTSPNTPVTTTGSEKELYRVNPYRLRYEPNRLTNSNGYKYERVRFTGTKEVKVKLTPQQVAEYRRNKASISDPNGVYIPYTGYIPNNDNMARIFTAYVNQLRVNNGITDRVTLNSIGNGYARKRVEEMLKNKVLSHDTRYTSSERMYEVIGQRSIKYNQARLWNSDEEFAYDRLLAYYSDYFNVNPGYGHRYGVMSGDAVYDGYYAKHEPGKNDDLFYDCMVGIGRKPNQYPRPNFKETLRGDEMIVTINGKECVFIEDITFVYVYDDDGQ